MLSSLGNKATQKKPSLVLCDRGLMDCSAYVSDDVFQNLLKDAGIKGVHEAREERYDVVVHLVTAAHGKESFYTKDNNTTRSESPEQARELDSKVMKGWSGHPNLRCIDNRTLFSEKVMRAVSAICIRCDVRPPNNAVVKRKFLVTSFEENDWKNEDGTYVEYTDSICEYTYLVDAGETQQRLKQRRLENGTKLNTHITRKRMEEGSHEKYTETKRTINNREYNHLKTMALPEHASVFFLKRSFVFNRQFFQLAVYKPELEEGSGGKDKGSPYWVQLEIYEDPQHVVELPKGWIEVGKEVTTMREYSMFILSAQEYKRKKN